MPKLQYFYRKSQRFCILTMQITGTFIVLFPDKRKFIDRLPAYL